MKKFYTAAAAFSFLSAAAILAIYVYFGKIFLDAGFYVYSADAVNKGLMPYNDFFFVQPPVYPYIYGLLFKLTGAGILQARTFSAIFGFAAIALAVLIAFRKNGRPAAFVTAVLLGLNSFQLYCFTTAKLYALTGFLLTVGIYFLQKSDRKFIFGILASVTLTTAVMTRLTLLPVLPILYVLFLFFMYPGKRVHGAIFVAASVLTGAAILLPFAATAGPAKVYYYLLGIHVSAAAGPFKHGLATKMGAVSHLIRDYYLFFICFCGILFHHIRKRKIPDAFSGNKWIEVSVWLSTFAVTAAHLKANWFAPSYQSPVFPVLALLVGSAAGKLIHEMKSKEFAMTASVLIFSAGLMNPVAHGRNSLILGRSPVAVVKDVGRFLAQNMKPSETAAVCNALYAVEVDRKIEPGFEGSPFTFTPEWNTGKCREYNSYNAEMALSIISERKSAILVLTDDSFAVGFPGFFPVKESTRRRLMDAVQDEYRNVRIFPDITGAPGKLKIYVPQ